MIVKDEEKYIRGCLESVQDIVDQIIIIDTGSNDKTVKIAKEFGCEVYNFTWVEDFSKARNESIKHATGDWILWLDADERLMTSSQNELLSLLKIETKPVIYKVQINSIINNGKSTRLSSAHRLFTNNKGIYFTGNIHEQISESAVIVGAEERNSHIILEHLGYNLGEEDQEKKDKRNLKMLQKTVKSNPQNAYAHFTLAQQYGLMKDWQKALTHYNIAERKNQFDNAMIVSLLNTKAEALFYLNEFGQAKECCNRSIKIESMQVGAYYILYRITDVNNDTEQAIKYLNIILENSQKLKKQSKTISTDVIIGEEQIMSALAMNYLKINKIEDAINYFNLILNINSGNLEIREKLIEIYLQNAKYTEIIPHLIYTINQFPEEEKYKELLGTVFIKKQEFHEAIKIYESLVIQNPHNQNSLKKLVGLYGKTGELHKANKLMQAIS